MEPKLSVGIYSGLYYMTEGYRKGLLELGAKKMEERKVKFAVLLGGLVDGKLELARMNAVLKGLKADERVDAAEKFMNAKAESLNDVIPAIPRVKTYIVTSPAYDGWIGEEVARRLTELRDDLVLYRPGGDRLELKQIGKLLGVYAPKKGVWMRGDYYDTPALRVLKDEKKRSTRGIGDTNAVGCLA